MIVKLSCLAGNCIGSLDEHGKTSLENVQRAYFRQLVFGDRLIRDHSLGGPGLDQAIILFGDLDLSPADVKSTDLAPIARLTQDKVRRTGPREVHYIEPGWG
jgi:hypothetical protein